MYANQSSELSFPIFLEGKSPNSEERGIYTRTPPNRYGPSSSLSHLCNFILFTVLCSSNSIIRRRGSFAADMPADIRPKTSVSSSKCWKNKTLEQTSRADVHEKASDCRFLPLTGGFRSHRCYFTGGSVPLRGPLLIAELPVEGLGPLIVRVLGCLRGYRTPARIKY